MSLIPLGFWAASGGGAAGGFDLLETQVLASSAASVTFTGLDTLAAGYQNLQIRMTARNTSTSNWTQFYLNGDTGSNYNGHRIHGNGSSVISQDATTGFGGDLFTAGSNYSSGEFTPAVIDLLDFSNSSKNSTLRYFSGYVGTGNGVSLYSMLWVNTAAVTSFQIASASNFETGSRFSLYGVK